MKMAVLPVLVVLSFLYGCWSESATQEATDSPDACDTVQAGDWRKWMIVWAGKGIDIGKMKVKWDIAAKGKEFLFNTVVDGVVVMVYKDLSVTAVGLRDGRRLWELELAEHITGKSSAKPTSNARWCAENGLLYLSDGNRVLCINCDKGELLWTARLPGNRNTDIAVCGDSLVIGTKRFFLCFDAQSGHQRWKQETWVLEYACVNDSIYCSEFCADVSRLSRRSLKDGAVVWSNRMPQEGDYYRLFAVGGEYVVVSEGCIGETGVIEELACLEQATGKAVWSKRRPVSMLWCPESLEIVVLGPGLYFREVDEDTVEDEYLPIEALDIKTGKSLWSRKTDWNNEAKVFNTPHGALFYCYDNDAGGLALLIDVSTGETKWAQTVLPHHRGGHSIWMQDVRCRIVGSKFLVSAKEPSGRYLEVFDIATGKRPPRLEEKSKSK